VSTLPQHTRKIALTFLLASAASVGLWIASATAASAHQSPAECDSNSVDTTPTRDKLLVRNGDVISYTVSLRNVDRDGQKACDLSNATVVLTLPATDGTPTGKKVTLATGADYPVGTSLTFPGTTKWTVNVNPGVTDAVVQVEVTGTLHDAPVDHAASIKKTLGTTVTQPHTTLSVTATPPAGRAPLDVLYTYTEKNDSSTDVAIKGVSILDSNCGPVTYKSGDTNNNQILDRGETWTFTCGKRITSGRVITSDVVGKGISVVDNRAVDDELAQVVVHLAQPHSVLTKSASPTHGSVPMTVTYTYTYTNDGPDVLSNLKLVDDRCSPLHNTGGDTNHDGLVQPGEKWTFTCSQTFTTPGTFVNIVTATAIDVVDHQPVPPLTAKAQVVTVSVAGVTVTRPPAAPAAPESVEAPPRVLGEHFERPEQVAPSFFARTGVRVMGLVGLALVALIVGAALLIAARHRRGDSTSSA
jgi:hypothetical protein